MSTAVMLVGSYPPPYGGCSVHVERLYHALARDFAVNVVDLYGTQPADDRAVRRFGPVRPANAIRALGAMRRARPAIAHFHVAGLDAFLLAGYPILAVLPRGARTIVTIHSGSFVARFERGPRWRRSLLSDLLRRFDAIVAVSEEQRDFLQRLGVAANKITVIPAFLPPVAVESARVRDLLASLGGSTRVVISSGYGMPHYGFHTILAAVAQGGERDERDDRTRVIICAYNSYDEAYMSELARRSNQRSRATIVRDLMPTEFAWLLERSDVYVRATDRDGDAVAIREALYFGKSTIASDCVARPEGVLLFKTDDAASLAEALRRSKNHPVSHDARDDGGRALAALRAVYDAALSA